MTMTVLPPTAGPTESQPPEEPTLGTVLARAANRLTDAHVAVLCTIGLTGAVTSLVFLQSARLSSLSLAIACFGGWTAARRSYRRRGTIVTRTLEVVFAIAGVCSIFVFGLSLLTTALGTWIS